MQGRPTGVVAACKDINLGREIQELFASPNMRVNTTTDVTGKGGAGWVCSLEQCCSGRRPDMGVTAMSSWFTGACLLLCVLLSTLSVCC